MQNFGKEMYGHNKVPNPSMLLLAGYARGYGRKSNRNESAAKSLGDQKECFFETAADYNIAVGPDDWMEEEAGHGGDEWWEGGGKSGLGDDEVSRTRPVFTEMMRGVQAGTIKCIIVWSTDRLWRSAEICASAIDIMANKGCLLLDRNGPLDISSPEGRERVLINAVAAQSQREHSRVNSRRGIDKSRAKGKLVSACNSLGFRSAGPHSGRIIHMEAEQEIVRRIHRMFYFGEDAEGPLSSERIAARLMDEGYIWTPDLHEKRAVKRTEESRSFIYGKQIRQCLSDIRYIGKQRHCEEEWDCPEFLNNGEPIVPYDLFWRVQEKVKEQARGSLASRNTHALSGRIRCGLCGQALTSQPIKHPRKDGSKVSRAYWMRRQGAQNQWCTHKTPCVRQDVLDEYIDTVFAPLLLAEIRERGLDNQTALLDQEQARLQRELCEAERHYREELPKYHRHKIDPEILMSMQEDAKRDIERLRAELRLVLLRVTKMDHIPPALESLPSVSPSARRDALRAIIRWIAVFPHQVAEAAKDSKKRRLDSRGSLVILTAWGTYHTVRMYSGDKNEHRNSILLRPATVSEIIGGVADFPDPQGFYYGLERGWRVKRYDFSPHEVTPGYVPNSTPHVAEFSIE